MKEYIMIHHSGTVDTKSLTWGIIRSNHVAVYEGAEHPYHFGIEWVRSSYEILLGRMPDLKGAHCAAQNMNNKAIGVCLVGNFDMVIPPTAQWNKSLELVRYLMRQFDIPKKYIIGHRDVKDTNCPGRFFDLGKLRSLL